MCPSSFHIRRLHGAEPPSYDEGRRSGGFGAARENEIKLDDSIANVNEQGRRSRKKKGKYAFFYNIGIQIVLNDRSI